MPVALLSFTHNIIISLIILLYITQKQIKNNFSDNVTHEACLRIRRVALLIIYI